MAKLTLVQSNQNHIDTSYYFNDYIDASSTGWYMQDSNSGDVFGSIQGTGITYSTYGNPTLGVVNAASSISSTGETNWTISGITLNATDVYNLESALRDSDAFDYYVTSKLLAGNDSIIGSSGNDYIYYSNGQDTIDGGTGVDTIDFSNSPSHSDIFTIDLSAGKYVIGSSTSTIKNIENIIGSNDSDVIIGSALNNVIDGGYDADTIKGGDGNDSLFGGSYSYDDVIYGESGNDTIVGYSSGEDIIDGGSGTDAVNYSKISTALTIDLSTGVVTKGSSYYSDKDTLVSIENVIGTAKNDNITGNSSNNVINGGAGNDTINGGAGSDTADYANAYGSVKADLSKSVATGHGSDSLINIENISGSTYGDVLTGSTGANTLSGNNGNDTLSGGAGNDILNGGNGSDWAYYNSASAGVSVNIAVATAQNTVSAGTDTLTNIENILGSNYSDILTGNALNNLLSGGTGNDTLNGGLGSDSLTGGAGKDIITGGTGSDMFIYTKVTETSGVNVDVISDFLHGTDKINLSAIDADVYTSGDQAFKLIAGSSAFTDAGQIHLVGNVLSGDVTGDGVTDFSITLTGVSSVTASDFVL